MTKPKVPYLDLDPIHSDLKSALRSSFENVLSSNRLVLGQEVKDFESICSSYLNVKHSIGVASGLDAIILSLEAIDLNPEDEVIVPSNTYIATWLAISRVKAKIKPVEPDIKTYNIGSENIRENITEKTKAIIPVHLYGQPCDMSGIMQLAEDYDLKVIEDNAQSYGATWNGQKTGSFGHANASSFYPGKNLGALGDAGMIHTNDSDFANKVSALRNYGSHQKYVNDILGYNSRLDELQASFLKVKHAYIDQWNRTRNEIAKFYSEELSDFDELILPFVDEKAYSSFHIYTIRLTDRDSLKDYLNERGIQTIIHYPIPPHLQKAYSHLGYSFGDFPIAEEIANTCLSLPIYPGISHDQLDYVCQSIRSFLTQ